MLRENIIRDESSNLDDFAIYELDWSFDSLKFLSQIIHFLLDKNIIIVLFL